MRFFVFNFAVVSVVFFSRDIHGIFSQIVSTTPNAWRRKKSEDIIINKPSARRTNVFAAAVRTSTTRDLGKTVILFSVFVRFVWTKWDNIIIVLIYIVYNLTNTRLRLAVLLFIDTAFHFQMILYNLFCRMTYTPFYSDIVPTICRRTTSLR